MQNGSRLGRRWITLALVGFATIGCTATPPAKASAAWPVASATATRDSAMATPVPTPSSPSPSAPSTPAPSPSSDRGAAENPATREAVIANYFAALNAAQAERAWELLSPSAQAQTRPRELEGAAAATRSIAVTRAEAVTSRVNEAVYRVTLAATPNPEDPSNWSAGPNVRRVRLDRTPSGRRIDEIAGSPIPDSPSAPTPDSAWKRVATPT